MTVGEVPDAANTRWLRWHHERTPIVCPPRSPPSSPPRSSPGRPRPVAPQRRGLAGSRWLRPLTRGAFRHQLGAGREAGAGRVMASFSGFAFQSLIHFTIFFWVGVRVEEGAERGQRSGAFPPRAFRAAHGAPATAREARSAIGCALGCGGPARTRPHVLSREARVGGWRFAGSGSFRRARAAGLLFAPGRSPACRPRSARTPERGAERGEPEGYPGSWRAAEARAGFEVHKLKAKQT